MLCDNTERPETITIGTNKLIGTDPSKLPPALVRLMAPILSFTAEEVWSTLTGKPDESVFLHTWYELPAINDTERLLQRWTRMRDLRAAVTKQLEELRAAGKIGSSLAAALGSAPPAPPPQAARRHASARMRPAGEDCCMTLPFNLMSLLGAPGRGVRMRSMIDGAVIRDKR